MTSSIEDCPNEVIENITELLELSDICALRLANQSLSAKATQDHFKSFFRARQVDITRPSLQLLVKNTKPGQLGCLIRDLTITGIVNNTKRLRRTAEQPERHGEDVRFEAQRHLDVLAQRQHDYETMHQAGLDVALLAEAFGNLAASAQGTKGLSICLTVVMYRTDSQQRLAPGKRMSWTTVWQTAAVTFQTVLQAMTRSQAPITALRGFQRHDQCSIACNDLPEAHSLVPFPSVRCLSLSYSDRIIEHTKESCGHTGDSADEPDWEKLDEDWNQMTESEMQAEADDERNFNGLANLVRQCEALEELELHHYKLRTPARIRPRRERHFQRIVELAPLPHLRTLTLRGLTIREGDLLNLAKRCPLRNICLEHIGMLGHWRAILDHWTSEEANIKHLYLGDLFEGGPMIFDGPETRSYDEYPTSAASRGNILERFDADMQQPITYHPEIWMGPSNPAEYEWRARMKQEFGPP